MAFLQCQNDLHKNLPYDVFSHKIFFIFAFLDQLCHVSIFTVLHYYEQLLCLLVKNPKLHLVSLILLVIVFHYIGMIELLQYLDLSDQLLPLSFTHPLIEYLLPHHYHSVTLPPYLIDWPKAPYNDHLYNSSTYLCQFRWVSHNFPLCYNTATVFII